MVGYVSWYMSIWCVAYHVANRVTLCLQHSQSALRNTLSSCLLALLNLYRYAQVSN